RGADRSPRCGADRSGDVDRLRHPRLPRAGLAAEQSDDDSPVHQRPGLPSAVLGANHVGWRHMDDTQPNAGHRAVATLERVGVVSGVITQNVDLLHTKAGSENVINLHGTYAQVVCLGCGHTMTRAELAKELDALNPGFTERVEAVGGLAVAPDADAVVTDTAAF